MRGATHTQHTAPQKTWVLFFLLTPTHLTSARSTRTPNSSPHSYRKPQLPFFLTTTKKPQLPFFFTRTTTGSSFVILLKSVSATRCLEENGVG